MDYEKELIKASKHADKVKQRQEIHKVKHSNDKPKEKLSFSKMAFIFIMINCTVIEIYSLVVMALFTDLSPLPTMIAAVVGECVSLCCYYLKSTKENIANGIVYESAMKKLESEINNNNSVG